MPLDMHRADIAIPEEPDGLAGYDHTGQLVRFTVDWVAVVGHDRVSRETVVELIDGRRLAVPSHSALVEALDALRLTMH